MRNSQVLRRVAVAAAGVIFAGMAVAAGSTAAFAAGPNTLTFSPETGTDNTAIAVSTIGFCPTGDTSFNVAITSGQGLAGSPNIAPKAALSTASVTGTGYTANLAETMATWASNQTPAATLGGPYVFSWNCFATSLSSTPNGSFTGQIDFTGAHAYVDGNTTTTLASSVTGTQSYGASPLLTATVANTATSGVTATPTGTVQFYDGTTAIGSPVNVSGTGTASLTLDGVGTDPAVPAVGSHSYTAQFTSTSGSQWNGSVSGAQTLTITAVTTTLALTGPIGTVYDNQVIPLSATVTPSVPGTVNFYANGTASGTPLNASPIPVSAGVANFSVPAQTASGTPYMFSAAFTSSNPGASNSTSSALSITVTHFVGVQATENIQVTVTAGTLTITTPSTPVVLSTPVLNAAASALVATGTINPVTVTDTCAGNIGYQVTGQLTGIFTGGGSPTPSSATDGISGDNLGWAPVAPTTQGPSQTASAGPTVAAPLPPLTCSAPPAALTCATNGINLQSKAATLGTAAAGGSYGTIIYNAGLTLDIPTNTGADLYQDTLTLTAF